ncbi:MAG: FAD-dependent oxidoreductase [Myxococcales bacterium]
MPPVIRVFGAGVAGLTVAHELAARGMRVIVHEPDRIGGKAASQFDGDLPGEHGFRFFAGWYLHLTSLLSRISTESVAADPAAALVQARKDGFANSVKERLQPVEYTWGCWAGQPATAALQIARAPGQWLEFVRGLFSLVQGISPAELQSFVAFKSLRLAQFFFTPPSQRHQRFDHLSLAEFLDIKTDSDIGLALRRIPKALVAMDGFAGSCTTFLNACMLNQAPSWNPDMPLDRVLKGPTSKAWIEPWVAMLEELGVTFDKNDVALDSIELGPDGLVRRALSVLGNELKADAFVLALPIDHLKDVFVRSQLPSRPDLDKLLNADVDGTTAWMVGLQLYLTQATPLHAGHMFAIDSQYGLTALDQTKVWSDEYVQALAAKDPSIKGLISAIVTQWESHPDAPNAPKYPLPKDIDDRATLLDHAITQLAACRSPKDEPLFDPNAVFHKRVDDNVDLAMPQKNKTRMLIHPPGGWQRRPTARTSVPNLFLASDFVKNPADLATMEGACAAGSIAANAILSYLNVAPDVQVHDLVSELEPSWLTTTRNTFSLFTGTLGISEDEALARLLPADSGDADRMREATNTLFNPNTDFSKLLK